jgi:hypothetical protein
LENIPEESIYDSFDSDSDSNSSNDDDPTTPAVNNRKIKFLRKDVLKKLRLNDFSFIMQKFIIEEIMKNFEPINYLSLK